MMQRHPGSFRDPSGFIYHQDGLLLRQVNQAYRANYDRLMTSGLYEDLTSYDLLVTHEELALPPALPDRAYRVIAPAAIDFVSYPSEWCFSQLKAAALATLEIQRRALAFGMSLKDASGFNIQFHQNKPVLIDTLSFETYSDGEPWVAYRQFCEHFLGPLALMSWFDLSPSSLFNASIEGVPVDVVSRMLPARSYISPATLLHIHLHAFGQRKWRSVEGSSASSARKEIKKTNLVALIDGLQEAVSGMTRRTQQSQWDAYYDHNNYSPAAMESKVSVVTRYLERIRPQTVCDIGSNRGDFSRIAAEQGAEVISIDSDHASVENNYLECIKSNRSNILPLVVDIANPTPDFGWHNAERSSFLSRVPRGTILALAVIHHLVITKGVPFAMVAGLFAEHGDWLIIEFPSPEDSQVAGMLAGRSVIPEYNEAAFRSAFAAAFEIAGEDAIPNTHRTLFLMKSRRP